VPIQAVLWDFGGVFTTSPFEAFNRFEAQNGLPRDLIRTINSTNPDTNAWALYERTEIDRRGFDQKFLEESTAVGHPVRGADVLPLLSGDVRPRMVEALRICKANFKVGCITNNMAAAGTGDWLRGVVDGVHQVKWAWEARGSGAAGTVTEQGWRLFRDRLAAAEARLAAAHTLAPDRPQAAAEMVLVCMGQGRDRAAMEGWFAKAVAADPDDPWAYRQKLTYLMPKWHGSEAELLAFARQCLRASTGDDRHNEYLYLAYRELATRARQADAPDVWSRPGVWADLRAAYEPGLAAHPGDRLARTQLFRACVLCGQLQAADQHRRRLAAGGWWEADLPPAERRDLEQRLDAALGQPAPGR
jgi:hypothetical protein